METILKILDNEAVLGIIISVSAYLISLVWNKKPEWKTYLDQYQGTIIAGIKAAEKAVPDDSENKSIQRLNLALQIVVKAIGDDAVSVSSLKEAIQVMHASMEVSGNLDKDIVDESDV